MLKRLTVLGVALLIGLPIYSLVQAEAPSKEPISAIKPAKVANPAMAELGKKLFFDTRLSKSGFISCNSCHINLVVVISLQLSQKYNQVLNQTYP